MTPTIFTFARRDFGTTDLGPYLSEHEAKTAYQRLFGTWPAAALSSVPWKAPR